MLFDRHSLLLALIFVTQRVAGLPANVLPEELESRGPAIASFATSVFETLDHASGKPPSHDGQIVPSSAAGHGHDSGRLRPLESSDPAFSTASPRSGGRKPDPKSSPTSVNQHGAVRSLSRATRSLLHLEATSELQSTHGKTRSSLRKLDNDSGGSAMASSLPESSPADFFDVLGNLRTSIGHQLEARASADPSSFSSDVLSTSVSMSATASPTPTTTNALDILESALETAVPSSLRAPIESIFPGVFGDNTSNTPTTRHTKTGATSRTTRQGRPTAHPNPEHRPTQKPHSRPHPSPTIGPATVPTTLSTTSSTLSTSTTTSQTSTPTPTIDRDDPANIGAHPIKEASVIGIASGLSAGAVLVGLGGIFLWRRKKQGKPMFGRANSQKSTGGPYPQVAWLYDPVVSRPGSPAHSRTGSGANLVPAAAPSPPGGSEVAEASPSLRPVRPSSPLLMPEIRIEDDGMYRGRGESGSYDNWRAASRGMRDDDED